MLSAIAFVPPNDVIRYFDEIRYLFELDEIHSNFNDECDDLIDYSEDTYIHNFCFIKFIK